MTKQEVFDIVYNGLKKQGFEKSEAGYQGLTSCAYRGDNGRKCAAGMLFTDDDFNKAVDLCIAESRMDAETARNNVNCTTSAAVIIDRVRPDLREHLNLISALQKIHDRSVDSSDMQNTLVDFAKSLKLNIP